MRLLMACTYVGTCDTLLRAYMLVAVAVVVAFVMCWAPFHAQRLLTIYIREDQWTDALLETQSMLFYTSGMTITQQCTVKHVGLLSRSPCAGSRTSQPWRPRENNGSRIFISRPISSESRKGNKLGLI